MNRHITVGRVKMGWVGSLLVVLLICHFVSCSQLMQIKPAVTRIEVVEHGDVGPLAPRTTGDRED